MGETFSPMPAIFLVRSRRSNSIITNILKNIAGKCGKNVSENFLRKKTKI